MNIRPLSDRVVVRRVEEETTSAGGIVLPGSVAEKPAQGEVVAVGPGKALDNGDTRGMSVKNGDQIMFGKFSGTEIKVNDEALLVMREDDILAVIEA